MSMNKPQCARRSFLEGTTAAAVIAAAPSFLRLSAAVAADREAARAAAAARAKAAIAAPEGWEMGPFVKKPEPVLRPTRESRFRCPILGKAVRWEEQNTYNPAAVVRNGKIHLLYRADSANPQSGWGRTCRIGLAVSDDGINFTRHPEPVLYPDNGQRRVQEV